MSQVRIRIARVRPQEDADLELPRRATKGSVGLDLCAGVTSDVAIQPGSTLSVPTGFAVAIPDGYEGQVRPRSGLSLRHGIRLPNAPGTIDPDYRGEVHVILHNAGPEPFLLRRGDRIAQLVIAPVASPEWEEVEGVEKLGSTSRGSGGFGHSGS